MLAIAWGVVAQAVSAQIPCAFEISAVIEGPKCQIFGQSPLSGQAINSHGHVAGYYQSCAEPTNHEAFVWTQEGGVFTIPRPAGVYSALAFDISDDDVVVGTREGTPGGFRAFMYDLKSGAWTELPPVNGIGWSQAIAINSQNVVCGYRSLGISGSPYPWQAFIWSPENGGTFTDLGVMNGPASEAVDITDNALVVGTTGNSLATDRAFIYDMNTRSLEVLEPIPSGVSSVASAVNSSRIIVGYGRLFAKPPYGQHAFVFDSTTGEFATIAPTRGFSGSSCFGISSQGLAIGAFGGNDENTTLPFVWSDGRLADLNELLVENQSLLVYVPAAIGDDDTIVAHAHTPSLTVVTVVLSPRRHSIADLDDNCRVNMDDLLHVIAGWGQVNSPADVDASGLVDVEDLMIVIENWTPL